MWHPTAFAVLPSLETHQLDVSESITVSLGLASSYSPGRAETSLQVLLFFCPQQHTSCSAGI